MAFCPNSVDKITIGQPLAANKMDLSSKCQLEIVLLVVVPGKIFHSLDKVLYGCGPVATGAGRRVWNVEARHHLAHLVGLQVQESLDQVTVNETLREKKPVK